MRESIYKEIYDELEPIEESALLSVEAVAMGYNFWVGFGPEDIRRLILRLRIAEKKLAEISCNCNDAYCVTCPRCTYVDD